MILASSFSLVQHCSRFESYVCSFSACPLLINFYAAAVNNGEEG